jgi:hypothetical protein
MNARRTAWLVSLALVALTAGLASAEVPTAADFAACNMKAAEEAAANGVSASPRSDLPNDATKLPPDARPKAGAPISQKDPTGTTLSSDKDPQIEGLAADRANDKVYVAAYRGCMRQRGF